LDDLINKLHDPGERKNYEWIRLRIKRLWNLWVDAAKRLSTKQDFNGRQQKRVSRLFICKTNLSYSFAFNYFVKKHLIGIMGRIMNVKQLILTRRICLFLSTCMLFQNLILNEALLFCFLDITLNFCIFCVILFHKASYQSSVFLRFVLSAYPSFVTECVSLLFNGILETRLCFLLL